MAKKGTELVDLRRVESPKPGFVVCYGSGSPFRKEKNLYRVEKGKQRLANRALCVVQYYGRKCRICPHSNVTFTLKAQSHE